MCINLQAEEYKIISYKDEDIVDLEHQSSSMDTMEKQVSGISTISRKDLVFGIGYYVFDKHFRLYQLNKIDNTYMQDQLVPVQKRNIIIYGGLLLLSIIWIVLSIIKLIFDTNSNHRSLMFICLGIGILYFTSAIFYWSTVREKYLKPKFRTYYDDLRKYNFGNDLNDCCCFFLNENTRCYKVLKFLCSYILHVLAALLVGTTFYIYFWMH